MQITVNGDELDFAGTTLSDLLAQLGLEAQLVAIERNRVIVRRPDYAETRLTEGDEIEIVQFVGGGA